MGKGMNRIRKLWDKISYETVIFIVLQFQFLTGRALDLQSWSSAWCAMDYSMGMGSRFLIGSIYRLFYGDYLFETVAYKYVGIGIMLTITVLSIALGQLIRKALVSSLADRNAILGTAVIYVAAPFSIAYVWNEQNLGRLDVYMLLVVMFAVLAALWIHNVYVKMVVYTLLGVIGLAIHQGFAFLYYPVIVILMCYDVFRENKVHIRSLITAVISGLINVAVAVWFQFFSSVNFKTPEEMIAFLQQRTDLDISEYAIQLEYFGSMEYQWENVTKVFYEGSEAPFAHLFLILLILAPVLFLYGLVWKDVWRHLKEVGAKFYRTPYFYIALTHLCFVPMFVIHVDWGRHLAPLLAMPTFIFLFYLAKKDSAMVYAYGKMTQRIRKYPWYFVLSVVWIAMLDSFGARVFQPQADMLYNLLQYGFHIH